MVAPSGDQGVTVHILLLPGRQVGRGHDELTIKIVSLLSLLLCQGLHTRATQ